MLPVKKVDYNKPFFTQFPYFISFLFSAEIFPFLVAFALTFILFPISIYLFIIIKLIVTMMAYKLAFDVLWGASKGEASPKVMNNSMVSNAVSLQVLAVALVHVGILFVLGKQGVSATNLFWIGVILVFVTPAIYMFIALTNSLKQALNPLLLIRLIGKIPFSYCLIVCFWLAGDYFVELFNSLFLNYLPVFLNGIIGLFFEVSLLVMTFHIMGFVLYQNRRTLDLEVEEVEEVGVDKAEYQHIKNLAKEGQVQQALALLQELQEKGDHSIKIKELEKSLNQLLEQKQEQLSPEAQIHELLTQGKTQTAFARMKDILETQNTFQAHERRDYLHLIKHAKDQNQHTLALKLVDWFHNEHAKHSDVVYADFFKAQILYEQKQPKNHIKGILKALIKNHPQHPHIEQVKSWLKGLEI